MIIKSKFTDYYDGCTYMCGEDIFYERNMNLTTLVDEWQDKSYKRSKLVSEVNHIFNKYIEQNNSFYHKSICIIGELIVPFFTTKKQGTLRPKTCQYGSDYYNYSFEFIFDTSSIDDKHLLEHMNKSHIDLYNAIRLICTEPIISLSSYEDMYSTLHESQQMSAGCTINPSLKRLGFSKIIPNHQVIQELELYLNNLRTKEVDIKLSDKLKANNKGFDKQSFRRNKGNK